MKAKWDIVETLLKKGGVPLEKSKSKNHPTNEHKLEAVARYIQDAQGDQQELKRLRLLMRELNIPRSLYMKDFDRDEHGGHSDTGSNATNTS